MTTKMEKQPPLVKAMLRPEFYPHPVTEPIKLIQTHISYVFLTGNDAYKIKKHVNFGFLDFSKLEKREFYCKEEVRLNSRAAPAYYLGVLPIAKDPADQFHFANKDQNGEIAEYCVHMKQFPSGQLFSERLKNGQLFLSHMAALGRKVAQFHARCTTNEKILSFGTVPVVRRAYDENYAQTEKYIAPGIQTREQLDETKKYTDEFFATKQHLFQERINKKMIKEGHGDLHLRNITLDGDDIVLFDCIEFSEEFRFIDTMYDIGFVIVGLESKGRFDMANEFLNEYLERTGDWDGVEILRIYLTRQAYVKAKVKSFTYDDDNVEEDVKAEFIRDAKIYYTLAWKYTKVMTGRIFVICGLSGSGKSFVSKKLCMKYNAVHIRSDAVRKHICHVPLDNHDDRQIYTSEVSQMTYEYLRDVGCKLVPEGWTVVLDATYAKKSYRDDVIKKCQESNIDVKIVFCTAPVEELRRRVRSRTGDITDANENVLEMQLTRFEPPTPEEESLTITIDTTKDVDEQLSQVRES